MPNMANNQNIDYRMQGGASNMIAGASAGQASMQGNTALMQNAINAGAQDQLQAYSIQAQNQRAMARIVADSMNNFAHLWSDYKLRSRGLDLSEQELAQRGTLEGRRLDISEGNLGARREELGESRRQFDVRQAWEEAERGREVEARKISLEKTIRAILEAFGVTDIPGTTQKKVQRKSEIDPDSVSSVY